MAIDPLLFAKASESKVPVVAAINERVAANDYTEAKANVSVERILKSTRNEMLDGKIKAGEADKSDMDDEGSYRLTVPSADRSGLVSDDFELDESQIAAIDMLVTQQYGCLIGAAGSGKTTCQRFFLHKMIYGDESLGVKPMTLRMLDGKQGPNIALCAFTGIATQVIKSNMPNWLWPCCKTIHSLLEYGPVTTEVKTESGELKETTIFMPYRHKANKLQHDIIIIDEASMVGVDLWHQLLDACRPGTKIFLIGDLNQLPPVMSQSMFAYALSDWPVAELTHIHRQKEEAANKIIDVAHSILQGKKFEFDNPKDNPNWRVIGFELESNPQKAGVQIVAIANNIRTKRVNPIVDPEEPLIYDPYRDRIITAGNGYDENNANSSVEQFPINEALARLIQPPTDQHPMIIIDAGFEIKRFASGHRVMATRNEPPDVEDRVTNGMVGIILSIEENPAWNGDWSQVGPEQLVRANRSKRFEKLFGDGKNEDDDFDLSILDEIETDGGQGSADKRLGRQPASHKVTVEFVNGATRVFASKASVASLQLAYASTCHKTQGSQMDTAIIVVHHAARRMLSREWFYTAVTRAVKRVILLYTDYGMRIAISNQKIFGRSLEEKIQRYKTLQEQGTGLLKVRIRLRIEQ